jgi:hypothetical protein
MTFRAWVRILRPDHTWEDKVVNLLGNPDWPEDDLDKIGRVIAPLLSLDVPEHWNDNISYLGVAEPGL